WSCSTPCLRAAPVPHTSASIRPDASCSSPTTSGARSRCCPCFDGRLGAATDVKKDAGDIGPTRAASAPPGSFAVSGHDRTHAHMIQADPAGRFVLHVDLGLDKIFVWRFDAQQGTLVPADPPSVALPAGDGPRHFAFHPGGRWLYSVQEEGSTIALFD